MKTTHRVVRSELDVEFEEAKFIWGLGRTQDEGADVTDITVAIVHGEGEIGALLEPAYFFGNACNRTRRV